MAKKTINSRRDNASKMNHKNIWNEDIKSSYEGLSFLCLILRAVLQLLSLFDSKISVCSFIGIIYLYYLLLCRTLKNSSKIYKRYKFSQIQKPHNSFLRLCIILS